MDKSKNNILFDHNIGSIDEMSDSFPSDSENNEDFVGFELNNSKPHFWYMVFSYFDVMNSFGLKGIYNNF